MLAVMDLVAQSSSGSGGLGRLIESVGPKNLTIIVGGLIVYNKYIK